MEYQKVMKVHNGLIWSAHDLIVMITNIVGASQRNIPVDGRHYFRADEDAYVSKMQNSK